MMMKKFKYIVMIAASLGSCFAGTSLGQTQYINGIEDSLTSGFGNVANGKYMPLMASGYGFPQNVQQGKFRSDVVVTGSAGDFTGFTQPGTCVSTVFLEFTRAAAGDSNTAGTTASFGTNVTDLWIMGDASDYATMVGTTQAYALPALTASSAKIHFLLTASPLTASAPSVPSYWFNAALPTGCEVIIEPGSVDPGLDSLLSDTNLVCLAVGAQISLGEVTTITSKINRHCAISATDASTKATVTMNGSTTFTGEVNGISLVGPLATFTACAQIVDPSANGVAWSGVVTGTTNIPPGVAGLYTTSKCLTFYDYSGTVPNIPVLLDNANGCASFKLVVMP